MLTLVCHHVNPPIRVAGDGLSLAELMAFPAVTDLITAGKALGMGRTKSYELVRAGEFPCRVIRAGKTYRVPTADLLVLLGVCRPCGNPPEVTAAARHHPADPPEETAGNCADPGLPSRKHNGHVTRPDAVAALPRPDPGGEGLMVVGWLERWLAQARLRDSTRRGYEGHLRCHLRPRLSGVLLADLDVAALERLFRRLGARCTAARRRSRSCG